jgi:hypothetical protein
MPVPRGALRDSGNRLIFADIRGIGRVTDDVIARAFLKSREEMTEI